MQEDVDSGIRFIVSVATMLFISVRSSLVNFGTLLLYHFVKLKIALSPDRVCGTELVKSYS